MGLARRPSRCEAAQRDAKKDPGTRPGSIGAGASRGETFPGTARRDAYGEIVAFRLTPEYAA